MRTRVLLFSAIAFGWQTVGTPHAAVPDTHAKPVAHIASAGSLGSGFPGVGKPRPGSVGGPTIRGPMINGTLVRRKR